MEKIDNFIKTNFNPSNIVISLNNPGKKKFIK